MLFKAAFVIFVFGLYGYHAYALYRDHGYQYPQNPGLRDASGLYNVSDFRINGTTLPYSLTDSVRWQNVVFEKNGSGSIKTADTIFRQRYKRGYFRFETDTLKHVINFKKLQTDSAMYMGIVLTMHYQLPDSNTIQLWGKEKNDSLYVLLKRSNRHFQLAEKQFHWLSEYNR